MPPSLGKTNSMPVPLPFSRSVFECHIGAMSTSPRSSRVWSAAGELAIEPTLGSSDFTASNRGSILVSPPPLALAKLRRATVPSVEAGVQSPTLPLYSGFQRSSHEAGAVLSFLALYAMPITEAPIGMPYDSFGLYCG